MFLYINNNKNDFIYYSLLAFNDNQIKTLKLTAQRLGIKNNKESRKEKKFNPLDIDHILPFA